MTIGFLVNLCGRFRCVKCGVQSEACFQTKLFRTETENSNREYRIGESELVDGLYALPSTIPMERLRAARRGDWGLELWALRPWLAMGAIGIGRRWNHVSRPTILSFGSRAFESTVPLQASDWTGFTSSNPWLAELSGKWDRGRAITIGLLGTIDG